MSKVAILEKEKKAILKKIKDDEFNKLPFEKQFEKFYKSNKGVICGDLSELEQFAPLFYKKFLDDHICLDRYQTYHIDMFEEALCCIFDEKAKKKYQEDELGYDDDDFEYEMNEVIAISKELMDNNIRGWKQDW